MPTTRPTSQGTPTRVTAEGRVTHNGDNRTPSLMQVDFEYAAREGKPPVPITWSSKARRPLRLARSGTKAPSAWSTRMA